MICMISCQSIEWLTFICAPSANLAVHFPSRLETRSWGCSHPRPEGSRAFKDHTYTLSNLSDSQLQLHQYFHVMQSNV